MKNIRQVKLAFEKAKNHIAKERDKLRTMLEEAEEICESCDTAIEDLEHAIETLSQYL